MKTIILPAKHPEAMERALATLAEGGIVAFPTDTVYGIGARVDDPQAIAALFRAKDRPAEKAIPVLLGRAEDLEKVALNVPSTAFRLAEAFWPGPLTLVVPRHPSLPAILGPQPTVGVRIPDHPLALALLRAWGPLAVTSANRSGGANTLSAAEVYAQLNGHIPLILDGGRTPGGTPSTVVDCTGDEIKILRAGPLSKADLTNALKDFR
ncbi:MAG: threonylcarbamoyl-AMP synthase [Anaerolineae bacterium]|nr:MAG: threonylcarbamoyl-AMP synthase [Anaerolineae bacterium]